MSGHTGKLDFLIGDKLVTFHYDYESISEIMEMFGDDALGRLFQMRPKQLAEIAAFGLKRHNPEIDAKAIIALSPPVILLTKMVDKAISYAVHGPEEAERILKIIEDTRSQITDSVENSKKKSLEKNK